MSDAASDCNNAAPKLRAIGKPDPVLDLLADAFERQTNAMVGEMRGLSESVRVLGSEMRAEGRSTRLWMAGLVGLAILVLGGVVGVSVSLDLGNRTVQTTAPANP